MKKFRIKDDEGNNYEIEEVEMEDPIEETEPATLTSEEIISLKQLAAAAPSILALLDDEIVDSKKEKEEVKDEDEDKDKEIVDEDEEVIDTDEPKVKDSKKSYGSIEKIKKVNDSIDLEEEIAKAWAKRYGGR